MRPHYFMSDLHLCDPSDERTQRVLTFWESIRGDAEALYLVGDAFDFWLGYRSVIVSPLVPVLRQLAELVESGTRVVLLSGNHDPDPGDFLQTLGIEVSEGPIEVEIDGHRVWLEHGDLIDPRGWSHRTICRIARNPIARAVARLFPPDWTWRLSRVYARKPHDYSDPLPAALLTQWFPSKVEEGLEVVVIGHYHRAVRHEVEGGRFFALGDWVRQRTYLKYDGEFALLRDQGEDHEPMTLPPGDHGPAL